MILTRPALSDPDYLSRIRIVPFDTTMTADEHRRREQVEEVIEFWRQQHRERLEGARSIFNGLVITAVAAAAFFAWWCSR